MVILANADPLALATSDFKPKSLFKNIFIILNNDVSNKTSINDSAELNETTKTYSVNKIITEARKFNPHFGTTWGQGQIVNALGVSLTDPDHDANRVGYVYAGYTSSIPDNVNHGIREVIFYNGNSVLVKIYGVDTEGKYGEWANNYFNGGWQGWRRIVCSSNGFHIEAVNVSVNANGLWVYDVTRPNYISLMWNFCTSSSAVVNTNTEGVNIGTNRFYASGYSNTPNTTLSLFILWVKE